jgi:hypothetical protein
MHGLGVCRLANLKTKSSLVKLGGVAAIATQLARPPGLGKVWESEGIFVELESGHEQAE